MISRRLGHYSGPKLYVRNTDDQPLRLLGGQVIDRAHHLLPVFGADLYDREVLLFGSLFGKTPFILEPGFFRLFYDESYLGGIGLRDRLVKQEQHTEEHFHNICWAV